MVRKRKHSRFARELQRRCGSKQVAEVILFSGRWGADLLREAMNTGGAAQPAEEQADAEAAIRRRRSKVAAVQAKCNLRLGRHLARAVARGDHLGHGDLEMVQQFDSGELRTKSNAAIIAHGHGRLHAPDGSSMDIGGSIGGRTRRLLGGYVIPSHENFPID